MPLTAHVNEMVASLNAFTLEPTPAVTFRWSSDTTESLDGSITGFSGSKNSNR